MKERTRSIARYVIPGAIIVLVVIVTIWWFSSPSRSIARSPQQDVRSTTVSRGTMQVTVSVSGHLEPRSSVDLTFESPGEVAEVAVDVGERVSAGEPLARLDTRQLAVQVHQAEAALEMIEAQLAQAKAGPRPQEVASAEANLRAAEAQVNRAAADLAQVTRGASEAQIAAAEAQVAAAELQYRVTLIAHDRVMQQTEDSTRREQARNDLYAAEKALAAAQAQLDELLAGADAESIQAMRANLAAAQAQRDAAQAQLDLLKAGATPKQIEELEGQVAQAQASLAMAELALERATLRAPFDGIVAAIYITPGEMPPTGLPAITLLDDSAFRLVAQADEMDVGQLIPGQSAQVTVEAFPDV
ncbi:MAG TPA: HlyD family efflux transporter periplasmic adaptor subunit, partial [Chloroflexi bacterium]|nr:HlyD family efflux transporter periplasmic adaptor subunit [Chloroflexota bacterium]